MNDRDPVQIGKFLSLILRHEPGKFGVVQDEAGRTGSGRRSRAAGNSLRFPD